MNFFEREASTPSTLLAKLRSVCSGFPYHDYSLPTIYCYKDYPKLLVKDALRIEENGISINPSPKRREYYFFSTPSAKVLNQKLEEGFRCTVPSKLEGMPGATKRVEPVYELAKVFDPATYPNAKKRHQRIRYPFSFLEKEKLYIGDILPEETEAAVQLHDRWIAAKIADPKVHQHSLASSRYRRCVVLSLQIPYDTRRYGVWDESGRLLAVRIVGVQKRSAFDLAFFGDYDALPSQSMEYINVAIMRKLFDEGVATLNAGLSAEAKLKTFKNHYPCFDLISYQYKKEKTK